MQILRKIMLVLAVSLSWGLPGTTPGAHSQEISAADILRKCDRAEGYEAAYTQFNQVITTTSGTQRTLQIRSWAVHSGDKQLAEYLAPADIKGQKILMTDDGDNIWLFNAETRRTRKLGSHMKKKKVMGSDFTYEDQAGGKITEKYTGVLIREEHQGDKGCYVLDLTPTPKGPSYAKIRAWIAKDDSVMRRVDFYRRDQAAPFKQLIASDVRKVVFQRNGQAVTKMVPFKIVMTNLEDRTETFNVVKDIRFGVRIPDYIFNPRKLDS